MAVKNLTKEDILSKLVNIHLCSMQVNPSCGVDKWISDVLNAQTFETISTVVKMTRVLNITTDDDLRNETAKVVYKALNSLPI